MFRKTVLGIVILSAVLFASNAHAGKVELTTYYPAPYGEYSELSADNVKFNPQAGDPEADPPTGAFADPTAATTGKMAYSSAHNALYYYNGSAWASQGGGGGLTSVTVYGQRTCPVVTGFTETILYAGYVTVWQEADTNGAGAAGGFCSSVEIADGGSAWGMDSWWGQSEIHRKGTIGYRIGCCQCFYEKA